MKFKIKHLLILIFIAALTLAFFTQRKKQVFRHQTLKDAVEAVSNRNWQLLGTVGDQQGPFRVGTTFHFGSNAPGYSVTYMIDGAQKKYVIPSEHQGLYVKAVSFHNRKGNTLCLVFGRE